MFRMCLVKLSGGNAIETDDTAIFFVHLTLMSAYKCYLCKVFEKCFSVTSITRDLAPLCDLSRSGHRSVVLPGISIYLTSASKLFFLLKFSNFASPIITYAFSFIYDFDFFQIIISQFIPSFCHFCLLLFPEEVFQFDL